VNQDRAETGSDMPGAGATVPIASLVEGDGGWPSETRYAVAALLDAMVERAAELAMLSLKERVDPRWPEWMSVKTAAAYLDVSVERVRKLAARGALPYYQEGPSCRIFFRRDEIDRALGELRA
jgi:excisionase family DNA binding protein